MRTLRRLLVAAAAAGSIAIVAPIAPGLEPASASAAASIAVPGLPGIGAWATVSVADVQLRVVPRLDGGHDVIEVQSDPPSTCVWPSVDFRADLLLRNASLSFTSSGTCSDGSGGTADVRIQWIAYGGFELGTGGLRRPALVTLCQIADPSDCAVGSGAIGIGTLS